MDDLTKEEMEQLLAVFRDQALGILDDMGHDLLALEADENDLDSMARLRRGAHTIKGDAACIGLERVTELAHRLEDIVDATAAAGLSFETGMVNVLLESLDEMRAAIGGDEVEDIPQVALERMLEAISGLQSVRSEAGESDNDSPGTIRMSKSPGAEEPFMLAEAQLELVRRTAQRGFQIYLMEVNGHWSESELAAMLDGSEVELLTSCDGNGHFLISSRLSPEGLLRWLHSRPSFDEIKVAHIGVDGGAQVKVSRLEERHPVETLTTKRSGSERRGVEYVRVEAARIDTLLNLAGEMVIARSVMNQVVPDLEQAFPKNEMVTRFSGASMQMGKLIAELQKGVLKMRMVTIDHVFRRFIRPMRELAAERGKQVELEIHGGETELDRTLVDLIYEPLLHLLRNAVDHGLESSNERELLGKPRAGKIRMRAYHEGNQVVIEVSDDGRGVDINLLKRRAVDAGRITEAQARQMSNEDAVELMFLEGLSTAKEITLISGRGVGAAAVKSVVEELRGGVSVASEAGAGTTFTLRMPLTLAIIKGLLFSVSGRPFALPLLAVSEVARATPADMVQLDGFESFRLRDRFVSVVRPGLVLGIESAQEVEARDTEFFLIVVSVAGRRFSIAADTLIGEQEVVIKPLDSEWLQNEVLAGASVLGDGTVVLILDAGSMLRKAIRYERSRGNGQMVV